MVTKPVKVKMAANLNELGKKLKTFCILKKRFRGYLKQSKEIFTEL